MPLTAYQKAFIKNFLVLRHRRKQVIEKRGDIPNLEVSLSTGRMRRVVPTGGRQWQPTPEILEKREALERFAIRRVMKHG